ncbi:MAG: N-6 DNA methylase [candidate division KSB1 bacterium]|nr:N-6 DNA methylase [candidate division KSB1 bacterium]
MMKNSKLPETSARIPDTRETNWQKIIPEYLQSVTSQVTESARSHRFLLLLNDLFGLQPLLIDEYVAGIEKFITVKQKDRILKGEVDNLFGNLIIEFERDLKKKLGEAQEQLKRYVACLWSQEKKSQRRPYLCLATDGVNFVVYSPIMADPDKTEIDPTELSLILIEQVDWSQLAPRDVYFWLDRYFLRKEVLTPRSDQITKDFGVKSHAFQMISTMLNSIWKKVQDQPDYRVIFESWERYLKIVYGTIVTESELFCRHTYLATLAKLMAWHRLGDRKISNDAIYSILNGEFFRTQGLENFIEEDFFSWIIRKETKEVGIEMVYRLTSLLNNYNLRELSEDVLKSLYQELVDPKTRHDLGEFYTPDWLAHRMICQLLEANTLGAFFDPACGSGTFLYLAIREKRKRLGDSKETLEHILDSVFGIDIHPLAVIVAKTNYILALGDLLKREGKKNIPVYLADTIRVPERERAKDVRIPVWFNGNVYRISIEDKDIYFSEAIINNSKIYDEAIDCANTFAVQNAGKKIGKSEFAEFVKIQHPNLPQDQDSIQSMFYASKILKGLIEQSRDTIWAFILKNIYKPIFLNGRFDFVVGNPPWLSFRYAESSYQNFLKEKIVKNYRLLSGKGELITHLELASLFLLRAADLYLKENGTIAFVLPRSIFTADQHDGLRAGNFKTIQLSFKEIWDLEAVSPLFNVPSCVLFAEKKKDGEIAYPISGKQISGRLDNKNSSLYEAEQKLQIKEVSFYLNRRGKHSYWATEVEQIKTQESYYKMHFFQGATIVPRSFWFVEVKSLPMIGFNPALPRLESSQRAKHEAKNNYKDLVITGNVESRYLYATLLSTDLLPFGHLDYRLVVLPIEPIENRYRIINAAEARKRQYIHLAKWLETVEQEWNKRRGSKAAGMSAVEWLDYRNKLSSQNPNARYLVLYNTSGSILCAAFLINRPIDFDISDQIVQAKAFIVESVTYYKETHNKQEAEYLSALLNAPIIDKMIKPMQSRGLWGARHIHKKVLELPIPQFDASHSVHIQLAELGEQCTEKVSLWLKTGEAHAIRNIGVLRRKVREMLSEQLKEIDELVKKIL